MDNSQQTYEISTHQTLIDLNDDLTNFELTFTATSKDKAPFELLVVDQDTLDSLTPGQLKYQQASEGVLSGNIVADSNEYKSYFLCLKSPQPNSVLVEISKREVPPRQILKPSHGIQKPTLSLSTSSSLLNSKNKWKYILIGIVLIGGGILLYYMYKSKRSPKAKIEIEDVSGSSPTKTHTHQETRPFRRNFLETPRPLNSMAALSARSSAPKARPRPPPASPAVSPASLLRHLREEN